PIFSRVVHSVTSHLRQQSRHSEPDPRLREGLPAFSAHTFLARYPSTIPPPLWQHPFSRTSRFSLPPAPLASVPPRGGGAARSDRRVAAWKLRGRWLRANGSCSDRSLVLLSSPAIN